MKESDLQNRATAIEQVYRVDPQVKMELCNLYEEEVRKRNILGDQTEGKIVFVHDQHVQN